LKNKAELAQGKVNQSLGSSQQKLRLLSCRSKAALATTRLPIKKATLSKSRRLHCFWVMAGPLLVVVVLAAAHATTAPVVAVTAAMMTASASPHHGAHVVVSLHGRAAV